MEHLLTPQDRKRIFGALYKLSRSSTLYPHWQVLQNTTHYLYEDAGGGFCDVHRENYEGASLCFKILRVNQPAQVDKMFKVFFFRLF